MRQLQLSLLQKFGKSWRFLARMPGLWHEEEYLGIDKHILKREGFNPSLSLFSLDKIIRIFSL